MLVGRLVKEERCSQCNVSVGGVQVAFGLLTMLVRRSSSFDELPHAVAASRPVKLASCAICASRSDITGRWRCCSEERGSRWIGVCSSYVGLYRGVAQAGSSGRAWGAAAAFPERPLVTSLDLLDLTSSGSGSNVNLNPNPPQQSQLHATETASPVDNQHAGIVKERTKVLPSSLSLSLYLI